MLELSSPLALDWSLFDLEVVARSVPAPGPSREELRFGGWAEVRIRGPLWVRPWRLRCFSTLRAAEVFRAGTSLLGRGRLLWCFAPDRGWVVVARRSAGSSPDLG